MRLGLLTSVLDSIQPRDGAALGTLCIIDRQPRQLSDRDLLTLQDLAILIEKELDAERMSRAHRALLDELEAAKRQALIDPLTGFWTRAGLMRILQTEVSRARREGAALAIAMADIDHFKTVNDTHGHAVGNEVLHEVSRCIASSLQTTDTCARVGGEEFVLVLPRCDAVAASRLADRIRLNIAGEEVRLSRPDNAAAIAISIGVARTVATKIPSPRC